MPKREHELGKNGFSLHTPFQDVEREFPQIITKLSLPPEEFGYEIAANHTFDVQNSKNLWYYVTDGFWRFDSYGIIQVMSVNHFGIDAQHAAHDLTLVLTTQELKFLLVGQVGHLPRSVRIERVIAVSVFAVIIVLVAIIGYQLVISMNAP